MFRFWERFPIQDPSFWRQVRPSTELEQEQEWAWGQPDLTAATSQMALLRAGSLGVGPVAFPDGTRLACFWASGCAPLLWGTRPTRPFQTRPPAGWLSPVRLRLSGIRPCACGRHFGSPKSHTLSALTDHLSGLPVSGERAKFTQHERQPRTFPEASPNPDMSLPPRPTVPACLNLNLFLRQLPSRPLPWVCLPLCVPRFAHAYCLAGTC